MTVVARPTDGAFHPLDGALREAPEIRREAVHRAELLDDTVVTFAEATGSAERLRATYVGRESASARRWPPDPTMSSRPASTTHEELGKAVGSSPATLGEHLRKMEATVFARLVL